MYIDRYEVSVRRAERQKLLILEHSCMHLASIPSTVIAVSLTVTTCTGENNGPNPKLFHVNLNFGKPEDSHPAAG